MKSNGDSSWAWPLNDYCRVSCDIKFYPMSVDHNLSSSESRFLSEDDEISTIMPYQFEPEFSSSEEGEYSAEEHREQENEISRISK